MKAKKGEEKEGESDNVDSATANFIDDTMYKLWQERILAVKHIALLTKSSLSASSLAAVIATNHEDPFRETGDKNKTPLEVNRRAQYRAAYSRHTVVWMGLHTGETQENLAESRDSFIFERDDLEDVDAAEEDAATDAENEKDSNPAQSRSIPPNPA